MDLHQIVPTNTDSGDFLWSVYEHATEQIVDTFFFEEDAKAFIRFNQNDGAFAGFTPAFMVTRAYKPKNLNDEFSASFEIE